MRFFTKSNTRALVAEKRSPIVIGPRIDSFSPSDLSSRCQLIPLEQAQSSKQIRFRTLPDSPEMSAEVCVWEDDFATDFRQPSTLQRQAHITKRSISGSSTATACSVDSKCSSETACSGDCSLSPEVLDYFVCHKSLAEDDSVDLIDQDDLFAELEALCDEINEMSEVSEADTVSIYSQEDSIVIQPSSVKVKYVKRPQAVVVVQPEVQPSPVKVQATKPAKVRVQPTLVPLSVAFNRPDIRYRAEAFEGKF